MALLQNQTQSKTLITDLQIANFWQRAYGLIPRKALSENEGLWISKCQTIHTCFMSFAIDCVFVDKNLKVQALVENIKPWRITKLYWRADSVIEMASGSIQRLGINLGDQLHVGH
jgi:uncharacterized membrane protein (UPF0127 family)